MTVFLVTGGILRRELDVFCKIRQRGLIPGGGAFRVSRCEGSSRSLAIGGPAICISARIFGIVFDRLAEFLSSSVKVFFLGKLDAALHIVSATALLGRFCSVDLSGRTPKNLYEGDGRWLFVNNCIFPSELLFSRFVPYRRENLCKGLSQSLGARIGDAVVSAVSADQCLARSTRIRCSEERARHR